METIYEYIYTVPIKEGDVSLTAGQITNSSKILRSRIVLRLCLPNLKYRFRFYSNTYTDSESSLQCANIDQVTKAHTLNPSNFVWRRLWYVLGFCQSSSANMSVNYFHDDGPGASDDG